MRYRRMPIEAESPEEYGYGRIRCNLAESSVSDASLGDATLRLLFAMRYRNLLGEVLAVAA